MCLILGVCFMVICFMYYATCKKMSAEINDLRKKADDYYDAICLLKEECNSIDNRFSRILWIMLITLKRSPVIRFLDNFMVALLGTSLGMAVMFAIVLFSFWFN